MNLINKYNEFVNSFVDKHNAIMGGLITLAAALLGEYWYLFAGFLLLNILDWITGWRKSRKLKTESSEVGWKGIAKKAGYWIIILVAFLLPAMFINLGKDLLGVNLDFLALFGWFTLASLIVNEVRSILENLVECGYNVPAFLIKGMAVTEKLLQSKTDNIT